MLTQPPSPKRGRSPPAFGPCLLRPNGCMNQDATWYAGRPRPRRHCVRWGPSPLPPKGAEPPPQFSAHFYCGQTARCIKMPFGMDVGLSPGDFMLDGDPVFPPQQRGRSPSQFSTHFYCAQTAGCIKMPLGMEVGLRPGEFVLDGHPAPTQKGALRPLPSPISGLRLEFRNWTGIKCGALPVVAM